MLGAAWYILSFDRYTSCWKTRCNKEDVGVNCYLYYLDCDSPLYDTRQQQWANVTNVFKLCDARQGSSSMGCSRTQSLKKLCLRTSTRDISTAYGGGCNSLGK